MTSNNIDKDKYIEKLLKKGGTETAPADFTQKVMEQVDPEPDVASDRLFSPLQWGLVGLALVAAVVTLFLLDVSFLNNIFSFKITELNISLDGGKFVNWVNTLFESLKMSTVTFMALAAILILLGLERLLRHGFGRANMNVW
jgi:hypothetical protein